MAGTRDDKKKMIWKIRSITERKEAEVKERKYFKKSGVEK
jgi:hypothetical protein